MGTMAAAGLLGSFILSVVLTAAVRPLAVRWGLVSRPRHDRYHRSVVPMGGGIALFGTLLIGILGALVGFGLLAPRMGLDPADFAARQGELAALVACALGLFALGLWDDKRRLGPFLKLAVQGLVALAAAAFAGVRVEFFIPNPVVTTLLSALWIVLMVNAFNFLDNMDGACAGIAAIVSGVLFTAAALSGQILVGGLALMFIGTLLGFLVFNFPPARIFMGDAGSLVVGFFVAVLSLRTTYYHQAGSGDWYPVLMPLIALAVPLYDFSSVTILRLRQGRSPFVGDTQHFSHRLRRRGLSDTQTVLTLYLATLCTGLGAVFLVQVDLIGAILIFGQTFMILAIIAILEATGRDEVSDTIP
ncbi:MAG: undecaprenyl/decaprenyl-phosphate alpha-N-acetylglucosaminyl 1-phosphate transferase [Phycisphaerae bacterium]|nr:undecaprenyl/decaprenyl-phosphate alpha-N-acetylglucosaminyl 1-phosphate transferase [Phycisphaerae bacterium]